MAVRQAIIPHQVNGVGAGASEDDLRRVRRSHATEVCPHSHPTLTLLVGGAGTVLVL